MTAERLTKLLGTEACPVIIDVRSRFEFERGHIPGAIHLPFFKATFSCEQLPAERDQELVLTCQHGPRAQIAMSILKMRGYVTVSLLEGHMHGWLRKSLPLVTGD